jgi:hypothetical protein
MSSCRTCHAPIVWAISATTGRLIPIDRDPDPRGNVYLSNGAGVPLPNGVRATPYATVVAAADRPDAGELHLAHFVTCPDAAQHRRRDRA